MTTCRDCFVEVPFGVLRCDYHAREMVIAADDADYSDTRSLHTVLRAAGFTSRATPHTPSTQRREILDAAGNVVAELTAHEAWAWLRTEAAR
jgi:hypothetical protein